MKKIFNILIISMLILSSCEEVVQLDLDSVDPVVIIEGMVTDQETWQYVKVSKSIDFYDDNPNNFVGNATVTVSDGTVTYNYNHNPLNKEEHKGLYFSETPFAGEVGKKYTLSVTVDGITYTAVDELFPVTAIDSLTYQVNEEEMEDPEEPNHIYEILFYAHEPQDREDFYLFKFYRNDTLVRDDPTDIYFSNDDLLAEEINGIEIAGYYQIGDVGKVEMYSISNAGFVYYNDLINLLQSDGGMFGSPPVNTRTNISGGALGFFQCSSVVSSSIEVTN